MFGFLLVLFLIEVGGYSVSAAKGGGGSMTTFTLPTGHVVTGAAASRQRLLTQLAHSANRQQNIDNLPTEVMVKLLPIKIQDLNEKNEILETTIRLQISWQDYRLTWDPLHFSNVSELVIPGTALWAPDVGVLNSVSDVYHVVHDTRFGMKVESNGRIWWHPTGIVKTYCKLYLRYFPFDRQKCKIVLESPTLDLRFMNLTLRHVHEPVDTVMYMGGETWDLVSVGGSNIVSKVGSKTKFSRVEFVIHIQRAKIYHMLNVILPAFFLSMVQIMFFLLPATHPQRVGSSTTTLLSVVVFHSVAVSQLPKTSTDVPLLAIYIIMVTFISGLSVCTSIFVAKFAVYADRNHPMPNWLRKVPHPFHHAVKFSRRISKIRANNLTGTTISAITADTSMMSTTAALLLPQQCGVGTELQTIPWVDDDNRSKIYETNAEDEQMLQHKPCLSPLPAAVDVTPKKRENTIATTDSGLGSPYLFNTWLDVSLFVDVSLMILAVMIAVLSPSLMFIIIPSLVNVDR